MYTTNTNHDIEPKATSMHSNSSCSGSNELPNSTLSSVNGDDDDEVAPDMPSNIIHVKVEEECFVQERAFVATLAAEDSPVYSFSCSEVEAEAMLEELASLLQQMEDVEEKMRIKDAFVGQLQAYVSRLAETQVINEARLSSLEQNNRHLHVQIAYLEEVIDAMVKERRELGDGEQFARPLFVPTPFHY